MTEPSDWAMKQARELMTHYATSNRAPYITAPDEQRIPAIARALDAARDWTTPDKLKEINELAYEAGRRAGIEEAEKACDGDGSAECEGMARQLRALLSPEPKGEK